MPDNWHVWRIRKGYRLGGDGCYPTLVHGFDDLVDALACAVELSERCDPSFRVEVWNSDPRTELAARFRRDYHGIHGHEAIDAWQIVKQRRRNARTKDKEARKEKARDQAEAESRAQAG